MKFEPKVVAGRNLARTASPWGIGLFYNCSLSSRLPAWPQCVEQVLAGVNDENETMGLSALALKSRSCLRLRSFSLTFCGSIQQR